MPAAFGGGKVIEDVDYKSKYNLKHEKDLIIEEMSRVFIENKESNGLNEEKVKDFYKHVKLYFTTCTDYMIKNLPISDPFLKHLAVADPDMIPHSSSDSEIFRPQISSSYLRDKFGYSTRRVQQPPMCSFATHM